MKSTLLLVAFAGAASQLMALDNAVPIPSMFPAERYETLIAKSPFALATPPAPVAAEPEKNFADGWFVSGLAQYEGKDFVTIKSRDLSVQLSLFGDEPRDGVTLQKVEWSPAIGRSTVTIAKDGKSAKLEFNQADLQSGAAPPPALGGQPQGSMRPPMPVMSNPGAPRAAVPRPTLPVVQPQQYNNNGLTNPNVTIPRPAGVVSGVAAPTPDSRRRIRVINNVPAQ